jgi:predicted dehydrogenase
VECFSTRDNQYHRVLGEDAHFYKLQIESFADTILYNAPMRGADISDGTSAIRALVAISRSVESGNWVHLADVTGGV